MKRARSKTRVNVVDGLAGILKAHLKCYAFCDRRWTSGPARSVDLFRKFSDRNGSIELVGECIVPIEPYGAAAVYLVPEQRAKPFIEFLRIAAVGLGGGRYCRSYVVAPGSNPPLECWCIGFTVVYAPEGSN